MSSNQIGDAIVIALDVGKSVSTLNDYEEETFFQSARNCASWIIQRKIISQSTDVLSLLLIGADASDPSTVKEHGYKNIFSKYDFQKASWSMLKFIEEHIRTSKVESDWLGALMVSLELLKEYEEYNKVSCKKVVIFSDFTKPVSDDLQGLIAKIKSLNVEVTIIGHENLQFSCESDNEEPKVKRTKHGKSLERQEGEKVAFHLWRELPEHVVICTFESALKQLCSYAPKTKKPKAWKCTMDIGDVYINVSLFKKTDPKQPKKFNTKYAKGSEHASGVEGVAPPEVTPSGEVTGGASQETEPAIRDLVMHYKHETGENKEFVDVEVKPEDTVEGFRYGKTVIPFTEEDKTAMKYETGPKSFSVVGFTHISSVPYYLLSGECSYVVLPEDSDENAEVALSALIQGMKKMKCLAVVRRVYSDNYGLSLGILYPIVEEIFSDETDDVTYKEYLLFVELAFEDDVKSIDFPSLEAAGKILTQQQLDAVDELIDGMNLMEADKGLRGEPCEAFDSSFLHDYKEQFFHYCVIQKGLHPKKPLPTSLPSYIENFIKVPKAVKEKCESAFNKIQTQFKIKKCSEWGSDPTNQWKKNVKEADGSQKTPFAKSVHFGESTIIEEENPITRSWMRLFGQGFPKTEELSEAFDAYRDVGEPETCQVADSFGLVLTQIRTCHLKINPTEYNIWAVEFKNYLRGEGRLESAIWNVIVSGNLGLITKEESQLSGLSNEEAAEFLSSTVSRSLTPKKQMSSGLLDELIDEQANIDFDSF